MVSRFSPLVFLDVPGTAKEKVRTCGFRRNSSSFDKAPKIRDFVLLNSLASFLVTFSSISSETWESNVELLQVQVCSVFCCFYCLPAFLSKLLLIYFPFLMLPYALRKNLVSGED